MNDSGDSSQLAPPLLAARFLPDLSDVDRENLQEVVSELFHHQAILKEWSAGDRELYEWARLHFPWVREIAALIGFEVILHEDDQLLYALPVGRTTLRRLRIDWTLVLLCIWYDYDVQLRAEGSPVIFTVETFNESLKTKLGDRMPSSTSLKEILAFFSMRKLIRIEHADDPARSRVEVLPTIRFVLPFGDLEKVAESLENLMAKPEEEQELTHG